MKNKSLLLLLFLFISSVGYSQKYKELINDPSVNFYDVVLEANTYFNNIDKTAKGSGFKPFERWKNANEYKFFPSGERDNRDPYFTENAYKAFLKNSPDQLQASKMAASWQELGPLYINEISNQYSVGLGRIEDFYVDPTNTNLIYLGSRSGGFWKTEDGGATWQGGLTDFLFASGVNAMAVSPSNSSEIFINVQNSRNEYSHGIYTSTDGGETWTETNFNPTNLGFGGLGDNFRVNRIAYHPTIANLVFVGTSEGIYRSDDNLATWTLTQTSANITDIAFHPTNTNILYLIDNNNRNVIYRTTNQGFNYSSSSTIAGNSNARGYLYTSPDCPNCVYFGSNNGVWRSSNLGVNFIFKSNPNSSCVGGFAVSDLDEDAILYGYVDTFMSADGGSNFDQTTWWYLGDANHGGGTIQQNFENSTSYVHADINNAQVLNGVFYVATDGFLSKSEDNGISWEILSQGTGIRENYKLGVSQSNTYVSMSGSQDNGTSIKKEAGWLEYFGADGMEAIIHPLNEEWMIGSFQFGGRIRTKDGGATQDGATPAGQSGSGIAQWEAPLTYDPNNQMQIYHFTEDVYISEDFGTSWALKGSPSFGYTIQSAAIAENNSDIMVVSSFFFIAKSIDGGATFNDIKNNLPNYYIQDIAFDPSDDDTMIVVYGDYDANGQKVYRTTNGGSSWTNITNNLGNMPIRSVVIDHTANANIYLGAEIGVYTMPMAGSSWSLYNTELPNTSIEELEIVNGSNMLKAATWGRGLWENPLVGRENYPKIEITQITNQPTDEYPKEGVDQMVTSTITYAGNLSSVYLEWSIDNPIFGNVIAMSNLSGNTWVSDTVIPDYPEGTKIYFKVFAEGESGDISETYKFMYTVQEFTVCAASGTTATTSDYINSVSLNGTVNNTGQDFYTYYDITPIQLAAGDSYQLMIQLAFAFSNDDAGAWIDFNNNGEFESDEAILMSAYNGSSQSFGTIDVPYNAVRDEVIVLRTRSSYFDEPFPCGDDAGEVEDYAIIIREPCFNKPTTSWNGSNWSLGTPTPATKAIFNTSYSTATANIEACSCEVLSGRTVTVAPNSYMRIRGEIKVDGSLVIEHTASVVQDDPLAAVINNGIIHTEIATPNLASRDFMLLGSPMTEDLRTDVWANAFLVLKHNTLNFVPNPAVAAAFPGAENFADDNYNNWQTYNGAIDVGEAYIVRPQSGYGQPGGIFDYVYNKGTLNNGDIRIPILYNTPGPTAADNKNASPNFFANPYPSAIFADDFINANPQITELYFWEHLTPPNITLPGAGTMNFSMQDLSMYNLTGGTAAASDTGSSTTPNGFISTAQGFGVKANDTGIVNFSNEMRRTSNNNTLRNPANRDRIWINVSNADYEMQNTTLIGFSENTSPQLDSGYDSRRLAAIVSLYSHLEDGSQQLAIQSREVFESGIQVPMGFSTQISELLPYKISIQHIEGDNLSWANVYLIDNQTNTVTNLREDSYSFISAYGTQHQRFTLVFEEGNILSREDVWINTVVVFPNPTSNQLTIISPQSPIEKITIFDLQGRQIEQHRFNGQERIQISMAHLETTMYFVDINTIDGQLTKQIIKN